MIACYVLFCFVRLSIRIKSCRVNVVLESANELLESKEAMQKCTHRACAR